MISKTLKDIALLIDGRLSGENITVTGLNGIKEAKHGDLTFLADRKYLPLISQTQASAIIVSDEMSPDVAAFPHICVKDPSSAFSKIVNTFLSNDHYVEKGIHPTAVIGEGVKLGQNPSIGPHVVIQKGVTIGEDVVIHAGCFIGYQASIGSGCEFYPNVTIRERVVVGHRVLIHSGAVLGADGFGFQTIDGKHTKIPQAGIVRVEDDVEIGANVTIDRARLHETVIGAGTKIDNLVQIGHNSIIGKNCLILAQVGISGSVVIEDNVIIAGQAGVVGHLKVGKGALIAGQSGVMRNVEPGVKVLGCPARPHIQAKRIDFTLDKLPEISSDVKKLKEKIEQLEQAIQILKDKNNAA